MDSYEASRIVFSRIQNLDPENASKIMGLLLIQDHGEKEMIRLAFGPEALLHSVILKARKDLNLPAVNSPSTPSTPSSSPSPFALSTNPISISRQSSSSSRLGISLPLSLTIPSPSSSSAVSWAAGFSSDLQNSDDHLISPGNLPLGSSCFAAGGAPASDMIDEFQLQDQLSFLNDGSPTIGVKNSDLFFPPADLSSSPTGGGFGSYGGDATWGGGPVHRRSCSVNDACLGTEDLNCGLGWKPCLYYARGFCKNGTSCRFLHGGLGDSDASAAAVGSPSKMDMMEQCHELLRSKSSAQQRLAAASQLMASANSFPYSPKSINFLLQQQQNDSQRAAAAAAAALMMGEDLHKFSRSSRLERNEFSMNGSAGIINPASRQIYLTFPADSTFKEEDVSNYFSMYGPVQDVRIPYQQKRMFGFVTFVYPETVKLILAKGNPHFVCDARVLVKPYKEKGKVPDKKQQQIDRDFSPCGTPTGLDSRELYDHLQLGSRMFYNTHQDLLWRRKLEEQQADLQTLDLQSRRLLNLQLLDVKKNQLPHHHHHRALSTGSPIPSPTHSPNPLFAQNLIFPGIRSSGSSSTSDILRENGVAPVRTPPPVSVMATSTDMPRQASPVDNGALATIGQGGNDKERSQIDDSDLLECFEHNLPDSPFASPAKATGDYATNFSDIAAVGEAANDSDDASSSILTSTSSLEVATSFKSYNCQIPRFPSGHSPIGMYAGTGGPTCPVGI
ncbi:zinc finger CCCH domain-containing protein 53 isoform X2 [Cucumis melo var. makuwa]|uniref:Zinc finger CCCH domain-containing protein 53 isoform X2 n=2 Tax=Cucumis melo TaxID=3656 RepID=A0A1S3BDP8_CUCME|nr:zinc finger CCCH domain-containing protein 53 isoform X2 [Cucumis melo]XP_050947293.1 zinc finger CCCH domain-containing protein 53 isoform X2 [Cucumis melo]KAA0034058.1 zinc finger CCCH domain-containing protein 53 isoform X2 [Cucumis melo var. makuwa]